MPKHPAALVVAFTLTQTATFVEYHHSKQSEKRWKLQALNGKAITISVRLGHARVGAEAGELAPVFGQEGYPA